MYRLFTFFLIWAWKIQDGRHRDVIMTSQRGFPGSRWHILWPWTYPSGRPGLKENVAPSPQLFCSCFAAVLQLFAAVLQLFCSCSGVCLLSQARVRFVTYFMTVNVPIWSPGAKRMLLLGCPREHNLITIFTCYVIDVIRRGAYRVGTVRIP